MKFPLTTPTDNNCMSKPSSHSQPMKTHSMQTVVSKLRALSMLVACIGMVSTHAQNLTWNGGGSDANFSDANNWGGTAPAASGNIIFFDGSLNTSPTNSQSDDFYTFKGITFNSTASSFTLVGSRIDLNGGINNNTSGNPQMINNALALLANLTVSVAANGSLTNAGVISGSFALSKTNAGVLVLLGAKLIHQAGHQLSRHHSGCQHRHGWSGFVPGSGTRRCRRQF